MPGYMSALKFIISKTCIGNFITPNKIMKYGLTDILNF